MARGGRCGHVKCTFKHSVTSWVLKDVSIDGLNEASATLDLTVVTSGPPTHPSQTKDVSTIFPSAVQ